MSVAVKEEAAEVPHDTSCSNKQESFRSMETRTLNAQNNMMVSTTSAGLIEVAELKVNVLKIEEHADYADVSDFVMETNTHAQQHAQTLSRWECGTGKARVKKMMSIAKLFSDLFPEKVCSASLYPRFRGSVIIQCPACMIPRNPNCKAAFLQLLLHVRRRHPVTCGMLFAEIGRRYAYLVANMTRKVLSHTRRSSKRLAATRSGGDVMQSSIPK